MEVNLSRTTFDKIEIGQDFYLVQYGQLVRFKKLPFEKAINIDDDSINHFQIWSGVFYPPEV
jgi:hypothetical protein